MHVFFARSLWVLTVSSFLVANSLFVWIVWFVLSHRAVLDALPLLLIDVRWQILKKIRAILGDQAMHDDIFQPEVPSPPPVFFLCCRQLGGPHDVLHSWSILGCMR